MQVLRLIARANPGGNLVIQPVRSQSMEYELMKAPYRMFLNNNNNNNNHNGDNANGGRREKPRRQLIVYNLPSTLAEYLSSSCQEEASYVRSRLYAAGGDDSFALVAYDPNVMSFIDGVLEGEEEEEEETEAEAAIADDDDVGGSSSIVTSDKGIYATLGKLNDYDASATTWLINNRRATPTRPAGGGDVVVLVGNGGREHALAVSLAKSSLVGSVLCYPGNGGTMAEGGKIRNATDVATSMDNASIIEYVKRVEANMVVVGPEQPLVDGLVDELRDMCPNVRAFGPTMAGAQLEASKVR